MVTALFDVDALDVDPLADTLSTRELGMLSGATFRQLDHWARSGRLVPLVEAAGCGTRRRWSRDHVDQARTLALVAVLTDHRRRRLLDAIGTGPPPWSVVIDRVRVTLEPV